jgi:hypothetical protein
MGAAIHTQHVHLMPIGYLCLTLTTLTQARSASFEVALFMVVAKNTIQARSASKGKAVPRWRFGLVGKVLPHLGSNCGPLGLIKKRNFKKRQRGKGCPPLALRACVKKIAGGWLN